MMSKENIDESTPQALDDESKQALPAAESTTAPNMSASGATLSALAASALLAACGGGENEAAATASPRPNGTQPLPTDSGSTPTPDSDPTPARPAAGISLEQAARFLLQAQFSASDEEIASVQRSGFDTWLNQHMDSAISQTALDWMDARGYGKSEANRYFFEIYPVEYAVWKHLMSAPDAVRKRVALALSEIFVISFNAADYEWRSHGCAGYWDMLNKNAFGNFRQLIEDVSLHPAMGFFLNTRDNAKEDPNSGRLPDENYAREIMQLFTIGLHELNNNGTEKLDNGKKIETYKQDDVSNLARVFTGWRFDYSGTRREPVLDGGGVHEGWWMQSHEFARKPMVLDKNQHSNLAVTFLGTTIKEGTPGQEALKIALDKLFMHNNVGPFIGKQLIQRLVTSNPSPAYVERVANAFNNNGSGVRGDMRAVIRAVLLDDEARNAAGLSDKSFGKLREPMLRLVQWARTFGATSAAKSWKLGDLSDPSTSLGQSPLRSPSVFNFFRPGYVPPGTELAKIQSTAPEFQIVNETTVGGYLNFMQETIEKGLNCPKPSVIDNRYHHYHPLERDIVATYTKELNLLTNATTSAIATADATALVKRINLLMCAGQISAATQSKMISALTTPPLSSSSTKRDREERVWSAVLMAMACPEYLVQK